LGRAALVAMTLVCLAPASRAADTAVDAMAEYMMFQEYNAGIILPQQIDKSVFDAVQFIDTRSSAEFAAGTIFGAKHIEWRQVFEKIDMIPATQTVVLFCNSGVLSAQATFALRVAGYDNVVVLQGGLDGWQKNAAYRP